jgi:hypothetical protein
MSIVPYCKHKGKVINKKFSNKWAPGIVIAKIRVYCLLLQGRYVVPRATVPPLNNKKDVIIYTFSRSI